MNIIWFRWEETYFLSLEISEFSDLLSHILSDNRYGRHQLALKCIFIGCCVGRGAEGEDTTVGSLDSGWLLTRPGCCGADSGHGAHTSTLQSQPIRTSSFIIH